MYAERVLPAKAVFCAGKLAMLEDTRDEPQGKVMAHCVSFLWSPDEEKKDAGKKAFLWNKSEPIL